MTCLNVIDSVFGSFPCFFFKLFIELLKIYIQILHA